MRCAPLLFILVLVPILGCTSVPGADLIVTGGVIYTGVDTAPRATALAARDGVILYVGDADGAGAYRGPDTRDVDLAGAFAFPGFTDAHMHIEGVGRQARILDLTGSASLGDLLRRLGERCESTPAGEWIVGRGWIETFWSPAHVPTRYDLDTVSPAHPVLLTRVDGHGAVANSRALARASIDAATPDPPGGRILHADKSNEPTGMLLDNAMDLVTGLIPAASDAEEREALRAAARTYVERGWTAVQVAGSSEASLARMRELTARGDIPLRVYAALFYGGPATAGLSELFASGPTFSRHFTSRTLKVSFDGALGSRGAALLAPYADAPETSGLLMHTDDELLDLFARARAAGIQIQVHAIGDRANRRILDLFEAALAGAPRSGDGWPRWRVEHAQILNPVDIPRFAALGVIPSMQPSHATTDLHFAVHRLGAERLRGAYAWRSLIDSGAIIAGGSDAPVEKGDPPLELYAASARRDLAGTSGEAWHPEERVRRDEALRMLTLWPAYAAFEEGQRGVLAAGMACDVSVFDRDLFTVSEDLLPHARCVMTIIDGEVVYRVPTLP